MGKPKNPNEVDKESFSDSLELFDSLFQEELEVKTNKQVPPKNPPPKQKPPSEKIAAKKNEQVLSIPDEEQSDELVTIDPFKESTPSTVPPVGKAKEVDHKKEPSVPEGKRAAGKKPFSEKKRDTLKMETKSAQPPSEPEQTEDETAQESGFGPIGMIRLARRDEEAPLPASASPEKIGKLYTPKESKKLIPNLSFKESNLYKVVLSGFAVAIIVMVLINFFGLIGSKEPPKPSAQIRRSASQKTAPKKRSSEVAKKPRTAVSIQKKPAKPSSSSRQAKTVKRPRAKTPPAPKTAAVRTSQPQPRTVYPEASRNTNSKKTPVNPTVSTEATSKASEKAQQETDISKGVPESVTPTTPETKTVKVSPTSPSPSSPQPTTEIAKLTPIEKAPTYPYSVYLGAYKTLKRARDGRLSV